MREELNPEIQSMAGYCCSVICLLIQYSNYINNGP
jgi:hypothetical protein